MKLTSKHVPLAIALALFPLHAAAETITYDIDVRIAETDPSYYVDLNGDGLDDVEFGYSNNTSAFVEGLVSFEEPQVQVYLASTQDQEIDFPPIQLGYETLVSVTEFYTVKDSDEILLFSEGDTVGPDLVADLATYQNGINDILSQGKYMGFEITTGLGMIEPFDGYYWNNEFLGETTTTYGFINVSQGSIILGQAGYNPTGGAAAVIPSSTPAVPLPASALLLGGALGGFGLMRRKARG